MRRCRTTAAADKLCSRLNEPFGKLRHVLGRAHVKLSSLHVARQSRVWLCRQLLLRDLAHLLERGENDRRPDTAIQTDHVSTPLIETFSEQLGRRPKHRVAVSHDRHLRDDGKIAEFTNSGNCLADLRDVGKSFEAEKIDATFE